MPQKKGFDLLHDSAANKSTAFNKKERESFGLRGLLPYNISNQEVQKKRILENIDRKAYDIERYVLLSLLQDRNEQLYYQTIIDHIEKIMPLIYTPTVGQACKEFSHIFRQSKGFYITPEDKGDIFKILNNWPEEDIKIIVITDGERILGLGDLGSNGMGIPIGKLSLYSACAGIHPHQCLPVMLDVGTNNKDLLNDPIYLGYPHKRIKGNLYFELVEEFVAAVQKKYPKALIQFEDFLTPNAYALLNRYRNKVLCFNDDIQGTAAVVLAGIYASERITNIPFSELRIMFLGAGSAATGIADLIITALHKEGLSKQEAYKRLWFTDINGLVVSKRKDLMEHNIPYAHNYESLDFTEGISAIKPHILIGATGASGTFNREVIELMSKINDRPVIFALSNPTDRSECTAKEAYRWSKGKAVFVSGSPYEPVIYEEKTYKSGQGNNAYIFPGIGLGAIACNAIKISDELFLEAAKTLSEFVSEQNIKDGSLYPPLKDIREVSLNIAVAVAEKAYTLGLSRSKKPKNLKKSIAEYMYNPKY